MLTNEQLKAAVDAYFIHKGNRVQAANSLGIPRQTFNDRLRVAERRGGFRIDKLADGRIEAARSETRTLPGEGRIKRYILTSAQNNTHVHPGMKNLLALVEYYKAELMIGTYAYQTNAYGAHPAKFGTEEEDDSLWYAPEVIPYIVDRSVEIAPGLVWCGEQNILPTARHPLTSMEDYNGRKSNIVPHAKIALESVASMANEATKLNYSTGTITQRNYMQKRAGIIAEQKHNYGALLVEVDNEGNWFVRQLHIAADDSIMDVGPAGSSGLVARNGAVEQDIVTSSIYWGDAHAAEMDKTVRKLCWDVGGILHTLKPRRQYLGDVFSMRSRGHHDMRDFHATYKKHTTSQESVEEEIRATTQFVNFAAHNGCETIIVPSNHDRHLDRWLNEADFRADPLNAKYFCLLQYNLLDAIDRGEPTFNILEFAMRRAGLNSEVCFLVMDESSIDQGIENGLHGDLGANGSRGSTKAFTKFGRAINKGHDHTAAIRDQVYSAGACALRFSYMKGPGSHSVSHIVTYKNGTRAIITVWGNKWRA